LRIEDFAMLALRLGLGARNHAGEGAHDLDRIAIAPVGLSLFADRLDLTGKLFDRAAAEEHAFPVPAAKLATAIGGAGLEQNRRALG
jgi:hypothetical protein